MELKFGSGKLFGYFLMFFIFTTILYFVLTFLDKTPQSWDYFTFIGITAGLVFLGKSIRYWTS